MHGNTLTVNLIKTHNKVLQLIRESGAPIVAQLSLSAEL